MQQATISELYDMATALFFVATAALLPTKQVPPPCCPAGINSRLDHSERSFEGYAEPQKLKGKINSAFNDGPVNASPDGALA